MTIIKNFGCSCNTCGFIRKSLMILMLFIFLLIGVGCNNSEESNKYFQSLERRPYIKMVEDKGLNIIEKSLKTTIVSDEIVKDTTVEVHIANGKLFEGKYIGTTKSELFGDEDYIIEVQYKGITVYF
jgi:uncharacterized lipoprotein NlpE involved in copper resistance